MKTLSWLIRNAFWAVLACQPLATLPCRAAAGAVDPSFDAGSGVDGTISVVVLQPDGKVLVGGRFTLDDFTTHKQIARLHADGSVDSSFDADIGHYGLDGPQGRVDAVLALSDGKVLIGGWFTSVNGASRTNLARLHADGRLDESFNANIGTDFDRVFSLAVLPDGNILVAGEFDSVNGRPRVNIARLLRDGTLDESFDAGGEPGQPFDWVTGLAVQPDGKIIIARDSNGFGLTPLQRLEANGGLDSSFHPVIESWAEISSLAVQVDGRVLIGGRFNTIGGLGRTNVARLNADGTPDRGFDPRQGPISTFIGAYSYGHVAALAVQPDGKVIIGGDFWTVDGSSRTNIARLNPDGSLDHDFDPGTGAQAAFATAVDSVALQPDGRVLLGGYFSNIDGVPRRHLARLLGDDSPMVAIPDPGLKAAIREALRKYTGDLTEQDLLSLTNLEAGSRGVRSLVGLEAARNLSHLSLANNSLMTNLTLPTELSHLTYLDLSANFLTELSVPPQLSNLARLQVNDNWLQEVSLPSGLTRLTDLDLSYNQLTSILLPEGLTNLEVIYLEVNRLTRLDLPADLQKLSLLDLSYNFLTSLTLPEGLSSLATLYLDANRLTNVWFSSGMGRLSVLSLNENQLTRVSLPSGMTNLVSLTLPDNPLTTLVLSDPLARGALLGTVALLRSQGVSVYTYPLVVILLSGPPRINGAYELTLTGPPGTYTLESTTNLLDWSAVAALTNQLGEIAVTEVDTSLSPHRFYRAHGQPF